MLKLMTLNLWGYYDWEHRNNNILALIREQAPDCIALQEVQTNFSFSPYPQSHFIAESCSYQYEVFAPTYPRSNQIDKGGQRTQRASYGLALLSKYPLLSSETHFLQRYPDHDEECSVLLCKVRIGSTLVDICNVHFANSDKHSDLHLRELMDICGKKALHPIILGDFNNFHLDAYKSNFLKGYALSTDKSGYTSMPKDNGTLDYIVVPDKYSLSNIVCPETYVSDHRALFATVT